MAKADWILIVQLASTSLVGVVGILATYYAGRRQQRTSLEMTRMQIESHERIAREERRERRIEQGYGKIMEELAKPTRGAGNVRLVDLTKPAAVWTVDPHITACVSHDVWNLYRGLSASSSWSEREALAERLRDQIRWELIGKDEGQGTTPPQPSENA